MDILTKQEALDFYIETGLPVWNCKIWGCWACCDEEQLPSKYNPDAVPFNWYCVIPFI